MRKWKSFFAVLVVLLLVFVSPLTAVAHGDEDFNDSKSVQINSDDRDVDEGSNKDDEEAKELLEEQKDELEKQMEALEEQYKEAEENDDLELAAQLKLQMEQLKEQIETLKKQQEELKEEEIMGAGQGSSRTRKGCY